MAVNNPQSADRSYKFMYKLLELRFHRYIYHEGDSIEFIETEIPDTGQRKDIVVKVDGKFIQITEFMARALNDDKLHDLSITLILHEWTLHIRISMLKPEC